MMFRDSALAFRPVRNRDRLYGVALRQSLNVYRGSIDVDGKTDRAWGRVAGDRRIRVRVHRLKTADEQCQNHAAKCDPAPEAARLELAVPSHEVDSSPGQGVTG